MLRRLDWIRDEDGFFVNYCWDKELLQDFERINVIYGNNGSGKSSLARLLGDLRLNSEKHPKVSLTFEDSAGTRTTNGGSDAAFSRILVFGEEYVARSFRFPDSEPDMDAILTLGERKIEDEERLEALRNEKQTLNSEKSLLNDKLRQLNSDLDDTYRQVANNVVEVNWRAGEIYQSRGKYTTAVVKKRLEEHSRELVTLTEEDFRAKQTLISLDNRDILPEIASPPSIREGFVSGAKGMLTTTPVTIVLETLKTHPEASEWVQEGLELHTDVDTCAFCGGQLTAKRRDQIEEHFSGEVEELQRALDQLRSELVKAKTEADRLVQSIPDVNLLFPDLREQFKEEAEIVRNQAQTFQDWCEEVIAKVTAKRENTLVRVEDDLVEPPAIDCAKIQVIQGQHNQRVTSHDELVQEAAKVVELHYLKLDAPKINEIRKQIAGVERSLKETESYLSRIVVEIENLQNREADPTPSADVLTREVARLLGHNELTFQPADDRYRVLRQGQPATNLSTGERRAITLIHFLETVARFDLAGGKPIVIIDDPVSSLDSSTFMGISTYIWSAAISETRECIGQLFLLTHNFDLFRQWVIQLDGLRKARDMGKHFPAQLYELRSRYTMENGVPRRNPVISKWPESSVARKKIKSSYHHAFLEMVQAWQELDDNDTLEKRLDAQMLIPNVIRRVLESFLAFKRPDLTGDFTSIMREASGMLEASGYEGDVDALRQRLTRFTHTYSHSQTPDINQVVNPDEIKTILSAVFEFMNHLDGAHFKGLCDIVEDIVKVDSGQLISSTNKGRETVAAT